MGYVRKIPALTVLTSIGVNSITTCGVRKSLGEHWSHNVRRLFSALLPFCVTEYGTYQKVLGQFFLRVCCFYCPKYITFDSQQGVGQYSLMICEKFDSLRDS